jgi:hypothetical protein
LLAFPSNQSDSSGHAVITAKGEIKMTLNTEETGAGAQPKSAKKARVSARRAGSAPAKPKSAQKAKAAKKAPKAQTRGDGARDGSKAAKVLELLNRPGGASLKEIMKSTDWQAHSVRGFLSGTLRKKLGLTIESTKAEDGERTYSIKN